MKKFFSVFVLCCLLGVPNAQAQKWRAFKQALVSPKTKITFYSIRRKTEAAVWRAAAGRQWPGRVLPAKNAVSISALRAVAPTSAQITQASKRVPPFPFAENDREMYRGMQLDADGRTLRYILKNGLEVSKSHYENFAAYDGKTYPENALAIYASHLPRVAQLFALDSAQQGACLPVILHLKKQGWRQTVPVPHDIPPSWIIRVSALLNVGGELMWGEINWQKGKFVFRPYSLAGGQK